MQKHQNRPLAKQLSFCVGDALMAALVLAAAALLLITRLSGSSEAGNTLQLWQSGTLIRELSLAEDASFTLEGDYDCTITIANGKAAITQSSCPGEDCVHSGWISQTNQVIVCLPNRLELRIVSSDPDAEDAVDAVVY